MALTVAPRYLYGLPVACFEPWLLAYRNCLISAAWESRSAANGQRTKKARWPVGEHGKRALKYNDEKKEFRSGGLTRLVRVTRRQLGRIDIGWLGLGFVAAV